MWCTRLTNPIYCPVLYFFNCPKLKEISVDFLCQENDSTDLTATVDGLGRSCPRLQNIHIRLSNEVVLALTASTLRFVKCFDYAIDDCIWSLVGAAYKCKSTVSVLLGLRVVLFLQCSKSCECFLLCLDQRSLMHLLLQLLQPVRSKWVYFSF